VFHDTASALFGVAGLRVTDAEAGPDGAVEVWAVTDYPGAGCCPGCGMESSRVHEVVVTRPKDLRRGDDPVDLRWVKRRLKCGNADCGRKTSTERIPAVPPGCRVMPRLREHCGAEVADRGITPAEAARHAGVSWPVAHGAFAARADALLDAPPAPVAHLGIDEHRRGRARWRTDPESGQYVQLASRSSRSTCAWPPACPDARRPASPRAAPRPAAARPQHPHHDHAAGTPARAAPAPPASRDEPPRTAAPTPRPRPPDRRSSFRP
jgi:hypothetical protein